MRNVKNAFYGKIKNAKNVEQKRCLQNYSDHLKNYEKPNSYVTVWSMLNCNCSTVVL